MGRPRLTEYLLKLATDADELDKFRKLRVAKGGPAKLHAYLTQKPEPGLTEQQAKAVYGHDSDAVVQAVHRELKKHSSRKKGDEFYGIGFTVVTQVNNVLQLLTK